MDVDCRTRAITLLEVLDPLFQDLASSSIQISEGMERKFYILVISRSKALVESLKTGDCYESILDELLDLISKSSFESSYLEIIANRTEYTGASTTRKLLLKKESKDNYKYLEKIEKRLNEAYRKLSENAEETRD